jgi:hypothetical protein
MVTDATLLGTESFDWDQEQPLSEKESYQALFHSLARKQGFNLLFSALYSGTGRSRY